MMLHSAIHWPDVADPTLCPLAVKHAVLLVNHMPDPRTGLSPSDVFTKTRWEQQKLTDVHIWAFPVYVLDKMISDGKKLPRWTPRSSTRTVISDSLTNVQTPFPLFSTRKLASLQLSSISSSTIGSPLTPHPLTIFRTSMLIVGNGCSRIRRTRTSLMTKTKIG